MNREDPTRHCKYRWRVYLKKDKVDFRCKKCGKWEIYYNIDKIYP